MSNEYERSLVMWANTFGTKADSIVDFASGDLLVPVARAVLPLEYTSSDSETRYPPNTRGWSLVLSLVQSCGLLEDAGVPQISRQDKDEEEDIDSCGDEGKILAVSCLEALLRYAVSALCIHREDIIHQIMCLDAAAQCTLRRIIVGQGSSEAGSPLRESTLCESSIMSPAPSSMVSPSSLRSVGTRRAVGDISPNFTFNSWVSPLGNTWREMITPRRESTSPQRGRNLELEVEKMLAKTSQDTRVDDSCSGGNADQIVAELRSEIARLKVSRDEAELGRAAAAAREADMSEELLRARRAAEKAVNSGEMNTIAVEKALQSRYEQEALRLKEQIRAAEDKARALEPLEGEVLQLRDEVDVLRPAEMKLSRTEENLARCRAKLEELSDLPQQLKREEDAHAKVLDRCLALESEVSQIPPMRRQIDGYRRSKTEIEVANREQLRELKLAQEDVVRLTREVQALSDGSEAVRGEHRRLQEELKSREMEEQTVGGGIGQGVSELNPALSEELARLRRANQQLVQKLDYNTVQTIQDLEQRVDDANRLTDSFHEQLAAERERSAAAESSLANTRKRVKDLEAEMDALGEEHRATIARLESEAEVAAKTAAEELASSQQETREILSAAKQAAEEELESERCKGTEALAAAQDAADQVVQGLRADMARAAEEAKADMAAAEENYARAVAELEKKIEETIAEAQAEKERAEAQRARDAEERSLERRKMGEEAEQQAELARLEQEEAAARLTEVKRIAREDLDETKRAAAGELTLSREETAQEKGGREDERRMKDKARAEAENLREEFASGKKTALEAIERLKERMREVKEEEAQARKRMQENHESRIEKMKAELDTYRDTHTVSDPTYHADMDQWEHRITTQQALISNLKEEAEGLKKDKRRLEREKAYYWGQAEELRISSVNGGGRGSGDATMDADHAQLLEQAQELMKENRHLKQRLQGADGMCTAGQGGIGGAVGAGSTRWGGSGVAAMRAEHESEVNALKEQTQDMVMKYQATATRVRELEQRCAEQSEGIEELQLQLTKQQLVCKRQEKKLASAAGTGASGSSSSSLSSSGIRVNMPPRERENDSRHTRSSTRPVTRQTAGAHLANSKLGSAQGSQERRSAKIRATSASTSPDVLPTSDVLKCTTRRKATGVTSGSRVTAVDLTLREREDVHKRALRDLENAGSPERAVPSVAKGGEQNPRRARRGEQAVAMAEGARIGAQGDEETPPECVQS